MVDECLSVLEQLLSIEFVNRNPLIACGVRESLSMLLEYYRIEDESIKQLKPLYLAMVSEPPFELHAFHQGEFSKNKKDSIKRYFYQVYSQYSCNFGSHMNKNSVKQTYTPSVGIGIFYASKQDTLVNLEHRIECCLKGILEYNGQDSVASGKCRFP